MDVVKGYTFLFVFLLSACSSTTSVVTGDAREPVDPEYVQVYLSPPELYEEVALLESSSKNSWAWGDKGKMKAVMKRLKKEAGSLGANGILLLETGNQRGDAVFIPSGNSGYVANTNHKAGKAIAIYVP